MGRKYALIKNYVVVDVLVIEDEDFTSFVEKNDLVIDVEDMSPQPSIGHVLNGNKIEIPQNLSTREQFEIDLNRRKSNFGKELAENAIDRIGARNKILNKNGSQVTALLTALIGVKSLLETGALGTARSSCVGLRSVYTEYTDIFDIVISEINKFESVYGL